MVTTAQSTTQTSTTIPSAQSALPDVCSTPALIERIVGTFFHLSIFQQGCVDTLLLGAYYEAPCWALTLAEGQTTVQGPVISR